MLRRTSRVSALPRLSALVLVLSLMLALFPGAVQAAPAEAPAVDASGPPLMSRLVSWLEALLGPSWPARTPSPTFGEKQGEEDGGMDMDPDGAPSPTSGEEPGEGDAGVIMDPDGAP